MLGTGLIVMAFVGASSVWLVDFAVKGAVLLVLASIATWVLRRDSAATRHLVWLLALVALLLLPALSVMLPQWRVLPEWATVVPGNEVPAPAAPVLTTSGEEFVPGLITPMTLVTNPTRTIPEAPTTAVVQDAARGDEHGETSSMAAPATARGISRDFLPVFWAVGFATLLLRLLAARWLLWRAERLAIVVWRPGQQSKGSRDPLVVALENACAALGLRRVPILLVHPEKTIPVVWGVFRLRLMLPASARSWSNEQLRSVLLHELAHVKRRDALAQLFAQMACALHWFNPLVWFAAWRLAVERERACDDLVLSSGVRPSLYAGHLLEAVSGQALPPWSQVVGLAMARPSALEGRLVAVLSKNLNRRAVSLALAAIALLIGLGIAVPLAMLRAAEEKGADPVKTPEDPKPSPGTKPLAAEEKLWRWGEAANGLRAALVIRNETNENGSESLNLFLVVQNVAQAAIRLRAGEAFTNPRYVTLRSEGKTLLAIRIDEPRNVDVLLQPREVAFVPVFSGTREEGRLLAKGLLADQRQTAIAEMTIAKAPTGAWTGKLVSGETAGAAAAGRREPKHEYGQSLWRTWQAYARADGKIPGALIGQLARNVDHYCKSPAGDDATAKLIALRPRLDATRDWPALEAVELLDDITALATAPVGWATLPHQMTSYVRPGAPLPKDLTNVAWGAPADNGLRAAWLLEPRAEQYPLGTVLKARVLFHNTGKTPVVFQTETWHQYDTHTARTEKGADVKVTGTRYTGITPMAQFRLAPGEYCEVRGHGIAIGAGEYTEERSTGQVGAVLEVTEGTQVHLSHQVDVAQEGWRRSDDPKDPARRWRKLIAERIDREAPLPASAADLTLLIRRAAMDLFGESPAANEIADFVADPAPDALAKLIARWQAKPYSAPFTGKLPTGETVFRVLAADPNAATKPRSATGPGRYVLANNIHLLLSQISTGGTRTNKATIAFLSPDPKVASPHQPYVIALPEGLNRYAIAWKPGAGSLWIAQVGLLRQCDFSNPNEVRETRFENGTILQAPENLRDLLRAALGASVAAAPAQPKDAPAAVPPGEPKNATARKLFDEWQKHARANGNIPGGLVAQLGHRVHQFIRANTGDAAGDPYAKRMVPIAPRLDGTHDWTQADAVALLNDIAAVSDVPLLTTLDELLVDGKFNTGKSLPAALANAPWGEVAPSGLRLAWLLEPGAREYQLGTPLASRLLIHNAGKKNVVFRTRTWHQSSAHQARDAQGTAVPLESIGWTTRGRLVPFRLAPGEYAQVIAAGIGVGVQGNPEDWQQTRVGTWVEAKAGDTVTFTPASVPLHDWNEEIKPDTPPKWWPASIADRLRRELPLPASAADRTALLHRAMREILGTEPTAAEIAAFVEDRSPAPLENLAQRLALRADVVAFAGSLASGNTTFRVLPADPDAAKKPRTTSNPGQHTVMPGVTLVVSRRPLGDRIINEAHLSFPAPRAAHPVKLPDGYDSWVAAWVRGAGELWVAEKGSVCHYDLSDPKKVKETRTTPATQSDVPESFRGPLGALLASIAAKAPPAANALPDDAIWKTRVPLAKIPVPIVHWSSVENGLRLGMRVVAKEGWRNGHTVDVELWVHNAGTNDIRFTTNPERADVGLMVSATDKEGKEVFADSTNTHILVVPNHALLPPGYVGQVKNFALAFDPSDQRPATFFAPRFRLAPGSYQLRCVWCDADPSVSAPGSWTGKLTSVPLAFTLE